MKDYSVILSRTLTAEFYRVNAMFFLVVMAFCFGFMRSVEHIALANLFVSSVWLVMIPVGVWIIYAAKVILYNNRETRFERNWFLYSLPLADSMSRTTAYATVALGQLAPAIVYGLFLVGLALQAKQFVVLAIVVAVLMSLVMMTAWMLHRALVFPEREKSTSKTSRWLDKAVAKPMAWIITEGIARSQPGMIYITKLATCVVIYGVSQLYLHDVYDERLYLMTACAAFSANLAIVYQYQRFEVIELLMMRSLPITFLAKLKAFVITMMILCFPEIAMLATNLPEYIGVQFYEYALVFGMSLLVFGYGALYVRDATFDDFTKWIFFVSMGLVLLILFKVPVLILAVIQLTLGLILLRRNYYSFELRT